MAETHEPPGELSDAARDLHRALTSLKEEIDAIDWYAERAACCKDPTLRALLTHNRDEEVEHACLLLEWLRRRQPEWQTPLATHLFREGELTDWLGEHGARRARRDGRGLGVGELRATTNAEDVP